MISLTPEELLDSLQVRICTVNRFKTAIIDKSDDTTEVEQNIYFQYYFCFSTAIEETIYNIISKRHTDPFLKIMIKTESKTISKYISLDEAKALIGDFGNDISFKEIKEFYSEFGTLIKENIYNQQRLEDKLFSKYKFSDVYKDSRDTRNMLAHGLVLKDVKYNDRRLFDFMCSFYILHKYHENVVSELNSEE